MAEASYGVSGGALAHLELLLSGAVAPLDRFLRPAQAHTTPATGRLADGGPAPVASVLTAPAEVADAATTAGALVLTDPEGYPIGRLDVPVAEDGT